MKLYKFRSNKNHIKEILTTKKFYFSNWKKLNDPMEGFYSYYKTEHSNDLIKDIYKEKNQWKICSLTKNYEDILLWSFYANGFKGICIEVEVEKSENLVKIIYNKNIPWLTDNLSNDYPLSARNVFTNKISKWEFEKEYRYFSYNEKMSIGKITAVIFGINTHKPFKKKIMQYCDDNIEIYDSKINFKNNVVNIIKNKSWEE